MRKKTSKKEGVFMLSIKLYLVSIIVLLVITAFVFSISLSQENQDIKKDKKKIILEGENIEN